jgi:hypothetical protein
LINRVETLKICSQSCPTKRVIIEDPLLSDSEFEDISDDDEENQENPYENEYS